MRHRPHHPVRRQRVQVQAGRRGQGLRPRDRRGQKGSPQDGPLHPAGAGRCRRGHPGQRHRLRSRGREHRRHRVQRHRRSAHHRGAAQPRRGKGDGEGQPLLRPHGDRQHGGSTDRHPLRPQGNVYLPGDGLRRRHQRCGRCVPPHPRRLRAGHGLRRCRELHQPAGHRRLYQHEGPFHLHRPRRGQPALRRTARRLRDGRGQRCAGPRGAGARQPAAHTSMPKSWAMAPTATPTTSRLPHPAAQVPSAA